MTTTTEALQDMNFKVDAEFHRAFKMAAVMNDLSMKELLDASFRAWIDQNGAVTIKRLIPKA